MAGGFKAYGPTYNSTPFVRLGYEGDINGLHLLDQTATAAANGELAGKIAAIGANGVCFANKGQGAVGLFREDLGDIINASFNASFYFRGGEYYVAEERLGAAASTFAVGNTLTTDANGKLLVMPSDPTGYAAIGTVVSVGEFRNGNMYEWAGTTANGGNFVGFILHM